MRHGALQNNIRSIVQKPVLVHAGELVLYCALLCVVLIVAVCGFTAVIGLVVHLLTVVAVLKILVKFVVVHKWSAVMEFLLCGRV